MHARLLDVLHDAADIDVLAVADRIDVDLDREIEEAVEQHRGCRSTREPRRSYRRAGRSSLKTTSIARPPST
jgi:hypothetical protein